MLAGYVVDALFRLWASTFWEALSLFTFFCAKLVREIYRPSFEKSKQIEQLSTSHLEDGIRGALAVALYRYPK